MRHLLFKEMFFTVPKPIYAFLLLGVMIAIPNYPAVVSVGYVFMAVFVLFSVAKENRDAEFTATLPVSRNRLVNARVLSVVLLELGQIIAAAAFAPLAVLLSPGGNPIGLDAGPTLFGAVLFSIGLFNVTFFPLFYRTGYKSGLPILLGVLAFLAGYVAIELAVQLIPGWHSALDSLNPSTMGLQSIVLVLGAILFAGLSFLAAGLARRSFKRVNL